MSDYWKETKERQAEAPTGPVPEVLRPSNPALVKKARDSAMWAFIIAGLSTVNLAYAYLGTPIRFALGLSVIDLISSLGHALGPIFASLGLVIDLALIGVVIVFGVQARRLKTWAFYTLISILVLDIGVFVALMLLTGNSDLTSTSDFGSLHTGNPIIVSVLIHLFGTLALVAGLQAVLKYKQRQRDGKA